MKKDIKDIFKEYLGHLTFDKALYEKVMAFRLGWMQKDYIYMDFLSGNLTGVHPIRFSTNDEDSFFIDLLNVDQTKLKYDLHRLEGIDKTRKVTSNVMYLTLTYLMHMFTRSNTIGKYRDEAIREVYLIFAYKAMSSLISHYFVYNVDEATAKAVYERLTNRFLIKRLGSWQAVFDHRSKDVIPPKGLHTARLNTYTTDDAVRVIADLQGRIRESIKNIYTVLIDVREKNEKIYSTSILEEDDSGVSTKDITARPDMYISYLRTIVNKPNDFINDDLVYLIKTIIPNLDVDKFVDTLKYISALDIKPDSKDDFISISIQTTLSYIRTKDILTDYNKHMYEILVLMKGYWSSSSVKDAEVKYIKKYLFDLTFKSTGKRTKWLLASISIAVLLYIFLRSSYKVK